MTERFFDPLNSKLVLAATEAAPFVAAAIM
jgi:hypothetical protein